MKPINILIIGSGGREHAIAWACSQSLLTKQLYVAPGNAGTGSIATNVDVKSADIPALVRFAQEKHIGLAIVGPEAPLAAGIIDEFQLVGIRAFGPTRAAAQLEVSKAYAKAFMKEYNIPCAQSETFKELESALDYVAGLPEGGLVIKASGLAAGKGVIVCDDKAEAEKALRLIMEERAFGTAGDKVLVEERLSGPELSVLAFCDGKTVIPMVPARDHKRAYDGDEGPNTGGMGVYAPPNDIDSDLIDVIVEAVLQPTVTGMAQRETPYVGVLYAGLMLTDDGPKVLEFNCRFGDPETQALMPLLQGDLVEIALACVEGTLDDTSVRFRTGACAAVVLASDGYPGEYKTGMPISGIDAAQSESHTLVFQAGTAMKDDTLVTSGGRVLAVSSRGKTVAEAVARAYEGVEKIQFEGRQFRTDIGR
jgi:phosphoribosylamine--glycine ligase